MKYQVQTVMMFNTEDDAIAFINLIEQLKDKVCCDKFEGGIENDLKCTLWKCYHDEVPPKQCQQIEYVDFKAAKREVKNSKAEVITFGIDSIAATKKEVSK